MSLTIKLFGPFQVLDEDGVAIEFTTERSRLLLFYLASVPLAEHRRETLCQIIWPDREVSDARGNLRTELSRLRKALGESERGMTYIRSNRNILALDPATVQIDVVRFDELAETVRRHNHLSLSACTTCPAQMAEAADLYTGPFLDGINGTSSTTLDEWIQEQRLLYQTQATKILIQLGLSFEERKEMDKAQRYAMQLLTIEPWHERANQILIRTHLRRGHRSAAMLQYERLRQTLFEALDATPSQETEDLVRSIHEGTWESDNQTEKVEMPYKGLDHFTVDDASLFFGREEVVIRLIQTAQTHPLFALIGSSGSGKSSLVQAGLVPNLHRISPTAANTPITGWTPLIFRPGEAPFLSLAQSVQARLGPGRRGAEARKMAAALRNGEMGLADLSTALAGASNRTGSASTAPSAVRLLVIIDQFEEIYTLCKDEKERQAFLAMLVQPAQLPEAEQPNLTVLLTLRADFMGYILADRNLADALQDTTTGLGPMRQGELRQAIEAPARLQGVNFEAGLVERLLEDVGNEPGKLPLVEFALTQLWEHRREGWITHASYDEIGGISGALANYAEGVIADLTEAEQHGAQRSFVQMVQPGQGTADSRRLAIRTEIGETDWPVVHKLADARLVVTGRNAQGQETAELVHEALIREWDRLQQWIDVDRTFRTWQQRLRLFVDEWTESGRDSSGLLSGVRLSEAEERQAQRRAELNDLENAFIDESIALRDARQQAREAQRIQELEAAKTLAETEAHSARRLRRLTAAVAGALLIVLLITVYAFQQQQEATAQAELAQAAQALAESETGRAEMNAELALARQLGAQSLQTMDSEVDLGVLLSLESLKRTNDPVDVRSLLTGLALDPLLITFLHGNQSSVDWLSFPDEETLIATNAQHEIQRWALTDIPPTLSPIDPRPMQIPSLETLVPDAADRSELGDEPVIQSVALTSSGSHTLYRVEDHLILWKRGEDTATLRYRIPEEEFVLSAPFSQDDSLLILDTDTGIFRIWEIATGKVVEASLAHDPLGRMCGVNADASLLAMSHVIPPSQNPQVGLWLRSEGRYIITPQVGHEDDIHDCTFSPDGRILATAGFDGTVRLWDTSTGELMMPPLKGHEGRVLTATFSPDGRILASGGTDNLVILWDVETGKRMGAPLIAHGNWVRSIAFSPRGDLMASADSDGKIALWQPDRRRVLTGHTSRVRSVTLVPDTNTFVSSSFDRKLIWWDADTGQMIQETETAHENAIIQIGVSPNGRILASIDAGGRIILWAVDGATGDWEPQFSPDQVTESVLIGLAFSPDSQLIALGDFEGKIMLVDAVQGEVIAGPIQAHENGWALSLAFSPDGSLLVSGSQDATIRRWSVPDLASVGEPMEGHENWVNMLLFEPDTGVLISGSNDQTIRRWDMKTGQLIGQPVIGVPEQVWGLHLAERDGKPILVSLGGLGSVTWWDWETFLPMGPPLHTGIETESMAVNAAGDRIFLGTFDETAQIWQVDIADWQEQACAIANRNMTEDEWQSYLRDAPYGATCF